MIQRKKLFFLGSESSGLSNKLQQKLDCKVAIKMKNNFDSLNVSVAAAILIYELI
jgi:23S rRNA (guanosine2251-2'-O)-methyltransferase